MALPPILDEYGRPIKVVERKRGYRPAADLTRVGVFAIISVVGTVAVFVGNIGRIAEFLFPSMPVLTAGFLESDSVSINIIPSGLVIDEKTEPIPLSFVFQNSGRSAATGVKAYLTCPHSSQIESRSIADEKTTWLQPNSPMRQYELQLPDLNPSEEHIVPFTIRLFYRSDYLKVATLHPEDYKKNGRGRLLSTTIACQLSSRTSPSKEVELQITLGHLVAFDERGQKSFWIGHRNDDAKVLQVKEDYRAGWKWPPRDSGTADLPVSE